MKLNPTYISHTHCQATQATATTQAWQRVSLSNRTLKTTAKPTDEKNTEAITACIRNSGVRGKSKVSAYIKIQCQAESEVLLSPLLLIHKPL